MLNQVEGSQDKQRCEEVGTRLEHRISETAINFHATDKLGKLRTRLPTSCAANRERTDARNKSLCWNKRSSVPESHGQLNSYKILPFNLFRFFLTPYPIYSRRRPERKMLIEHDIECFLFAGRFRLKDSNDTSG